MDAFIDALWHVVQNPHSWGGIIVGAIGVTFVYHKGWIVTGKSAMDLKEAEIRVAALEARIEAAEKHITAMEEEIAPWREFRKQRDEAMLNLESL